jgi:hypothetical protein
MSWRGWSALQKKGLFRRCVFTLDASGQYDVQFTC